VVLVTHLVHRSLLAAILLVLIRAISTRNWLALHHYSRTLDMGYPPGVWATFAGHFTFAQGKSLPPLVSLSDTSHAAASAAAGKRNMQDQMLTSTNQNPWLPTPDRTGVTHTNSAHKCALIHRQVAWEWLQLIVQHVLPKYDLNLRGRGGIKAS